MPNASDEHVRIVDSIENGVAFVEDHMGVRAQLRSSRPKTWKIRKQFQFREQTLDIVIGLTAPEQLEALQIDLLQVRPRRAA